MDNSSSTNSTNSPTLMLDQPHVAHVRYIDGDDHIRLQLRIHNDHKAFFRPIAESWSKLHDRLEVFAAAAVARAAATDTSETQTKKPRGRTRKKDRVQPQRQQSASTSPRQDKQQQPLQHKRSELARVSVRFFDAAGSEFLSKSLTIGDVLTQTARIEIGSANYVVLLNQPLVAKLTVYEPILAGIPIVPLAETEFCNLDECTWQWTRIDATGSETLCSTARRYTPSHADTDCHFRIECRAPAKLAAAADDSKTEAATTPVVCGPSRDVFATRRQLGRTRACDHGDPSAFRVMDYNVLFGGYMAPGRAQQLLFPYARAPVRREMYRMQLVFQEIEESSADIVCLQEMGEAVFHSFFVPVLEPLGFRGFYAGKTGSTQEGCAMFVRTDAFEVERECVVDLSTAVKQTLDPAARALLREFPDLALALDKAPSIAQFLLLRSTRDPTRRLVVANTHLFYRGDADMIRLLQTLAIAQEVRTLQQDAGGDDVGVVLCGDLNALPDSAAVQFLLRGHVDSSHRHWRETQQFQWNRAIPGNDESADASPTYHNLTDTASGSDGDVMPGHFAHDLALASACGIPEFTNFISLFVGTIDYVLFGRASLRVAQVFPLFSIADVSTEVAIPSSTFPSDHISLVCDLAWTPATTTLAAQ